MKNINLITVVIFLAVVFGLTVSGLIKEPAEISISERRKLAQSPEISIESISDGSFTENYREFLQDQAVFRESFRAIKSFIERRILLKKENNDVYIVDNNLYDKFYGINQRYIERDTTLINNIIDSIDSDEMYLSIIPSKAQMLDRSRYLLSDQNIIADYFDQHANAEYIDLMGIATKGNESLFYATDHHWTTEGAIHAYRILITAMGYEPVDDYNFELATDSYVGSYFGKAASPAVEKDKIYLAHNEYLDNMTVRRYETLEEFKNFDSIYFRDKIDSLDPYDIFIGGLGPITVIENDLAQTDEELVMFKDSYSHSLAPFLAQHFKKVTLFDLRYVRKELILDNYDLSGKLVLFIFSTTILNHDAQILN
ncbi:DHHW family protein [Chloroflexota bacterium]